MGVKPCFGAAPDGVFGLHAAAEIREIRPHAHHADLKAGDLGVICSFGAGYSIGSVVVRRI